MTTLTLTGATRYWNRNVQVFRRVWLLGIMAWFVEPVLYLVAMGTGLARYVEGISGSYIGFIAPGLLAVAGMYGATFEVTWNAFFKMAREHVYDAVTSAPISMQEVALGEILWGTTRATIYGSAFSVVAIPFGVYHDLWGLLTLPALVLVGGVFAVIGLIYTYLIKRVEYIAYYWTMIITPMFLFSGVFFPFERLPGWLHTVAWFMPLHHATEMMRALMSGSPGAAAGPALWLLAATLLLVAIPPLILHRRMAR
ncbi:MAG TPA: ABC transporter permease [Actinomycetota bacterium]